MIINTTNRIVKGRFFQYIIGINVNLHTVGTTLSTNMGRNLILNPRGCSQAEHKERKLVKLNLAESLAEEDKIYTANLLSDLHNTQVGVS